MAKAGTIKREDGKLPYHLTGSDRYEWLDEGTVKARNVVRKGKEHKWEPAPEHDESLFIEPGKEKPRTLLVDEEVVTKSPPATRVELKREPTTASEPESEKPVKKKEEKIERKVKSNPKAEKKIKPQKKVTKAKVTKPNKEKTDEPKEQKSGRHGHARQHWKTYAMGPLLRWCGKQGFGVNQTLAIAKAIKLKPDEKTLRVRLDEGARGYKNGKGEQVAQPSLSKDDKAELAKIAEDVSFKPDEPRKRRKRGTKAVQEKPKAADEGQGITSKKKAKKAAKPKKKVKTPDDAVPVEENPVVEDDGHTNFDAAEDADDLSLPNDDLEKMEDEA